MKQRDITAVFYLIVVYAMTIFFTFKATNVTELELKGTGWEPEAKKRLASVLQKLQQVHVQPKTAIKIKRRPRRPSKDSKVLAQ